jgi:hypothetical protein
LKHFAFFALSHYLNGVMMLFTVAALVIGIKHYKRHRNLRIWTWYIAFSLFQDMSCFYAFPDRRPGNFRVDQMYISGIGFVLFEFIACNLFILRCIRSPQRRRLIKINALLFFGIIAVEAVLTFPYTQLSDMSTMYVFLPESFFLVLPCLMYFYELFLTKNLHPLTDQPAFWVITGILFLNACEIPLLVASNLLKESTHNYNDAFSLNYVLYSLLFVLLIRAFLCPPESTQPNRNHLSYFT